MKRLAFLPIVLVLCYTPAAPAEPAFGGNCLSCHGEWLTDTLYLFGENTIADPDESGTGAPDRGPLPVFKAYRGGTTSLQAMVTGLATDETYAVALRRLRFPGVETGGELKHEPDCDWAQWGESNYYYSDPAIAYRWGTGPTVFSFDITIEPDATFDYYDLVIALGGEYSVGGGLFCTEQHFYVQVLPLVGDVNCDGRVNSFDIDAFVLALTDLMTYLETYPDCDFMNADINGDGVVNSFDIDPFVALLVGG